MHPFTIKLYQIYLIKSTKNILRKKLLCAILNMYKYVKGGVLVLREIYLDNAATTKPCEEAINAMVNIMQNNYANPSALHIMGLNSEDAFLSSKQTVAKALNVKSSNIYFTSGGTESNNTIIFGAAQKLKRYGKHIITGAIEHPSVLEPIRELEKQGYEVTILPATIEGYNKEDVIKAIRKDTILISLMTVNNENGAKNDFSYIKKTIKEKESHAYFHSDCVQAFLKTEINAENYDFITISSHKVNGPKGVGAMYISADIMPMLFGGGQQNGMRSGTVFTELICGFAAAVKAFNNKNIKELNLYAREKLSEYKINSPYNASDYILNISVLGYKSETLLHFLETKGIYVSTGSACAKGEKSYVLKAMGLKNEEVDSCLRISFSKYTTKEDIDELVSALKQAEKTLVKARK